MSKSTIDNLEQNDKDFVIDSLMRNMSQRKIASELASKGITISDVAIGRWWKENKENYQDANTPDDSIDTERVIAELVAQLDEKDFYAREDEVMLIAQQLLEGIMLSYLVDIKHRLKLKQSDELNHYPDDLINMLKAIFDMYLKIKGLKKEHVLGYKKSPSVF